MWGLVLSTADIYKRLVIGESYYWKSLEARFLGAHTRKTTNRVRSTPHTQGTRVCPKWIQFPTRGDYPKTGGRFEHQRLLTLEVPSKTRDSAKSFMGCIEIRTRDLSHFKHFKMLELFTRSDNHTTRPYTHDLSRVTTWLLNFHSKST